MSFLLFAYTVSAVKDTVLDKRHAIWQEPDLLSEKMKSGSSNIAYVFSLSVPTKFFFLVFFVLLM